MNRRRLMGMTPMRFETICDPPPGVTAVDGFQFYRDQNSMVIARCVACSVGFVVREDHAANVRRLMNVHQLHVCKPSLRGVLSGGRAT
jgi:hypothetical protein